MCGVAIRRGHCEEWARAHLKPHQIVPLHNRAALAFWDHRCAVSTRSIRGALLALVAVSLLSSCASTLGVQQATKTVAGRTITEDGTTTQGGAIGGTSGSQQVVTKGSAGSAGSSNYAYGVKGLTEGITDKTIKVGVPTIENAAAVTGLLGAADLQIGDPHTEARALINDLNARGGILGRKIEPVYAAVDYANPNIEAAYLASCNKMTDDGHVFAVLTVLNPPPSFVACVAQKGVLLINASLAPGDDKLIARSAPWYYAPTLVSLTRIPAPLIDTALRDGKLKPGDKVGMFAIDVPQFTDTVEEVIKPILKARGVTLAAYERVASEASIQNAVLRFRQAGVTHVIFEQASAIPVLLFMRQAESQTFRPKYLLTSLDDPGYLLEGNVADAQLQGISGIGWGPVFDVKPAHYPMTDLERRCISVVAKGGEVAKDRATFLALTPVCDLVWSFEAIVKEAGPQLSTVSFRDAYTRIGPRYSPVSTFVTDWSKRVDGSSAFRTLSYIPSCKCIQYTGPQEPLP